MYQTVCPLLGIFHMWIIYRTADCWFLLQHHLPCSELLSEHIQRYSLFSK